MTTQEGRITHQHTDDGDRGRAAVFFRLIIIIPHFIWLAIWSIGALLVAPVHWVIALIRGGPAEWAHGFYSSYVRYSLHVYTYFYLAAGRYPGFIGDPGYVVDADFPPPGRQSRWTIAFRFFIALPALVLAGALSGGLDGGGYSSQGDDAQSYAFSYRRARQRHRLPGLVRLPGARPHSGRPPRRPGLLPGLRGAGLRIPAAAERPIPDE